MAKDIQLRYAEEEMSGNSFRTITRSYKKWMNPNTCMCLWYYTELP